VRDEKEMAQATQQARIHQIKAAVDEAKREGFPTSSEEKEQYFLEQVSTGEALGASCMPPTDSKSISLYLCRRTKNHSWGRNRRTITYFIIAIAENLIEAALAFYKALKVYPNPSDLIGIYDKTVAKVRSCDPAQ
jgi:import receptor subunit TOM20